MLGKARGVLRAGRALWRAHRPLIGDEPAGHRQPQTASLVLSLKAGDAAVVRRLVAAAAAAAPSAGVIVIARLGHRPSHLRREEKEEEEEDDAAEGGEESGSGSTRHLRRHCFFSLPPLFYLFSYFNTRSPACPTWRLRRIHLDKNGGGGGRGGEREGGIGGSGHMEEEE